MKGSKYILSFLSAIFIFVSCNTNLSDNSNSSQKLITNKKEMSVNEKIYNSLFPSYKIINDKALWKDINKELLKEFTLNEGSDSLLTSILSVDTVEESSEKRIYVLASTRPINYDCHICSPLLGIAIFSIKNNILILDKFEQLGQMGNFGEAPEFELKKIGENKLGFIFHPGFSNQGITVEGLEIYTVLNTRVEKVFQLNDVYGSNEGICDKDSNDCWEYNYDLNFEEKYNKDFFNFSIFINGTNLNSEGKIVPVKRELQYQFKNDKYVEVDDN